MNRNKKSQQWIHSFSIGDTRKHKGYTIYKITSIVFPRYLPEAMCTVTLWKRFSDVKKLHKDLARKHRDRHLGGTVPELTEKTYFKRFDPAVIEERKRYILELLDFAGQEPVLYQSHAFAKFFERGITPDGSPREEGGNIAEICENLAIPVPQEITLVDPSRDESEDSGPEEDLGSSTGESVQTGNGSMVDSMLSVSSSLQSGPVQEVEESVVEDDDSMDYIVEAAIVFSKAAQAEANGSYKKAFDEYKAGIERLLSGAKDDTNVTRKKMAKEKTCKYVARAEEIYEKYLLYQEDDEILQLSPICLEDPSSPIQLLERPLNYLSRYKVVRVIEGRVMQVQDVTDRKFYVMKGIRKPPGGFSQAMSLPYGVPYMVPLVAYFQSDSSVFLLLKLICGGKLWDFIASYHKPVECHEDAEEDTLATEEQLDSEPETIPAESSNASDSTPGFDSGFIDLVNDYNSKPTLEQNAPEKTDQVLEVAQEAETVDEVDYIPSFDVLSKDMDVRELVSCSQQLLRAVSQTIEQSAQQRPWEAQEPEGSHLIAAEVPKRPHIDTASQLELGAGGGGESDGGICASKEADPLPEGCIKQWISELVIAVDNLHFNGIICG